MSKVEILRKKYPKFVYERYSYKISKNDLEIFFDFKIRDIFFEPKIIIKNINKKQIELIGKSAFNNFIFELGLMEIPSYWKTTCSPIIEIKVGNLSKNQIKWWQDFIFNGMGQFFFENKIDFRSRNFLKVISITEDAPEARPRCYSTEDGPRVSSRLSLPKSKILIPMGEGKDSIITLELFKKINKKFEFFGRGGKSQINCFVVNPHKQHFKIFKIAGIENPIIVQRKIDPVLLKMSKQGFLNGHTPITALISNLAVFAAVLFGFEQVAMSCERSANEGNIKYLGKTINHQWSKSFEFEKKFRSYIKKYLAKDIEYFSFLRPLYEIQIAKIFSRFTQYFPVFLSCNEARKTKSGTKKPFGKWCGNCSKCLFIFTIFYPFVDKKKLTKIFKKNLFEKKELLPIMKQLIGESKKKPFECVGTKKESLVAFYLSWKLARGPSSGLQHRGRASGFSTKLPALLEYFEKKILPKYPKIEEQSKKIMNSWNKQNYVPKELEKALEGKIFCHKETG